MPRLPASLKGRLAALLLLPTLLAAGCEDPPRVPYIDATLHNWEQNYRGQKGLKLHVFEVGRLALGGPTPTAERVRHVLAYVLEHPRRGLVVIDTGINHAVAGDADYLTARDTGMLSVELHPGEDLPSQMRVAHLAPKRVRHVLVTNLRLSHTGELEAFPHARVHVSRREHDVASEAPPGYLSREYDGVSDWDLLDLGGAPPLGTMQHALDLFGDGSVMVIDAPGPTAGNAAVLLRLAPRPVLLAGDLAAFASNLRHATAPPALRDRDAWWQTIWRVKRFAYLEPRLWAAPGYDAETWRAADLAAVRVHAPVGETATPPSETAAR